MITIARNDIRYYASTPFCYLFAALYFGCVGFGFTTSVISNGGSGMSALFSGMYGMLILVFPLLTQSVFPSERTNGTYTLLISSPVSTSSIVLGKFLGCVSVFLLTFALTFIFGIIGCAIGVTSFSETISCYLAAFLLGLCFISIGVFISAVCDRAIHCWLFTSLLLAIFRLLGLFSFYTTDSVLSPILGVTDLFGCFSTLSLGILNAFPITYMASFCGFWLFLTCKVIDKRKWGRGDAI